MFLSCSIIYLKYLHVLKQVADCSTYGNVDVRQFTAGSAVNKLVTFGNCRQLKYWKNLLFGNDLTRWVHTGGHGKRSC